MGTTTALVIENDPTDDARRLGDWLTEAGLTLRVLRPYDGDAVPDDLAGFAALLVLGGDQCAYPAPGGADQAGAAGLASSLLAPGGADQAGAAGLASSLLAPGEPGAPWFPALESLLRHAVRHRVPTLAICLGGQLLATAHGGTVEPSPAGPEIGPGLVARRDAAEQDPLFGPAPFVPDVFQWHRDEITELPAGAVLMAASTRYPHQAFRLGDRAWGTQFHIECDTAMIAQWASADGPLLAELGVDAAELVAACDALMGEVEDTWQPFAWRFAALAMGRLGGQDGANGPRTQLPLLGQ